MRLRKVSLESRLGVVCALLLWTPLSACGGGPAGAGPFVESLVRLLDARFVPTAVAVPRGATRTVDFEVVCDKAGLDTVFGRLGIRVKLDPNRTLPEGITATIPGVSTDASGFALVPCNGAHPDPNLRIAHVAVRVAAASSIAPTTTTLVGYVEVEPVVSGEPSKDSTRADLAVSVIVGEGTAPTT